MLTGRPPFTDNDAVVVMARHIKSTPKRPNEANPEANVPKELEDVVMRALAKDPADRPSSAEQMAGELLAAVEAQGALTSGVRASITNAAGIRVPDSMRPPPMPLPAPPKKKIPLYLIGAPIVVLVAALSVYLGMRGGRKAPVTPRPATATATVAATSTVPATPPTATTATLSTNDLPTVTPDALPKASTAKPAAAPRENRGRSRAGRRARVRRAPRRRRVRPPPRPTESSSSFRRVRLLPFAGRW